MFPNLPMHGSSVFIQRSWAGARSRPCERPADVGDDEVEKLEERAKKGRNEFVARLDRARRPTRDRMSSSPSTETGSTRPACLSVCVCVCVCQLLPTSSIPLHFAKALATGCNTLDNRGSR
jgi:hypothetical protein